MDAYVSIRQTLKQVASTAARRIDAGDLGDEDLDTLRAFGADVGKVVAKLDRPVPTVDKQVLFKDLLDLRSRCTGPLEEFQEWIEVAITTIETITA